jgi:hypothetical protein
VIAIAVVAAAVGAALFVVVRNAKKVDLGNVPPALQPVAPDTAMRGFRNNMARKIKNLRARCKTFRLKAGKLTPEQDSLSRLCDSGIASLRSELKSMDTCRTKLSRKLASDSLKVRYDMVHVNVRAFSKSGSEQDIEPDSLDEELKKLLTE